MIDLSGYIIEKGWYKEGKRSVVYRGIREPDRKPVILKTLKPEFFTPENAGRLLHEFEIARDLNLERIVRMYGLETYEGMPVLVMEDFGGVPLKDCIAPGGMDTADFLRLAIQVTAAVGSLHVHRIIHKDIKPSNIIIHPLTGLAKITDFGISSRLEREYRTSIHSDLIEGSFTYMSPEQTGRMNRAVDYRTDFYSLGISLYEALTGKLPFPAADPLEWVHCHIARPPLSPHQLKPAVPSAISAIISKLLAKTAEERYQSAAGLLADLEQCRDQLSAEGRIGEFVPGSYDFSDRFQISQKLYGRSREIGILLDAFQRVSDGGAELVLVTGYSGIGKSSIVREVQKPIVERRGYFISGKFDQFQRDVPYACLIQAFRGLVRQILTESDEAVAAWKKRLGDALDRNGQVIIDVIPEVRLIMGEQPPLPELPPAESQNRFNMVFRDFIGVFAKKEHPLSIFTDDLQWADAASLKLIQHIVSGSDTGCLLFIGAYRDNEIDESHPLTHVLNEIRQSGAAVRTISLGPLNVDQVGSLIADTLSCSREEAAELAELVAVKTGGNPYFVNEFLQILYDDRLLEFDHLHGGWRWELERIKRTRIADDMIDLIATRIRSLPEGSGRILSLGACIGSQFTLQMLSIVNESSPADTARELWPAFSGGFLVTDGGFRGDAHDESFSAAITFSFIHDRVQQAAHSLIDQDLREETHLRIGRLLLENSGLDDRESLMFDIVNHLNDGRRLVSDRREKKLIAGLNLEAGKKALASTAYESALRYLTIGMELLEEDSWHSDYELTSALCIRRLECELLCSNFERAERLFDDSLKNLRSCEEKAEVYNIKIVLCANLGRFREAIDLGLEALKMLGVTLPAAPGKGAILRQYFRSRWLRAARRLEGKRGIAALQQIPSMSDPRILAAMSILSNIGAPSYLHDKNMFTLIAMKMVNLSLEYGTTGFSFFAYALYGMMIIAAFGDYESGYLFGELALKLSERPDSFVPRGKTHFVFHNFIAHRKRPVPEGGAALKEVFQECRRSGDLMYAGYSLLARLLHLMVKGDPLEDVCAEGEGHLEFLRRVQNEDALLFVRVVQQTTLCLRGRTNGRASFDDQRYDEAEQVALMKRKNAVTPLQGYYLFKSQALYILGNFHGALQMAAESEKLVDTAVCQVYQGEHYLYHSLILAEAYPYALPSEKRQWRKMLKRNLKRLQQWAGHSPENFRHKYLLVAAEFARISGAPSQAMAFYEEAARSATEEGFIQCAALAHELAARMYLAQGAETAAKGCLLQAYRAYAGWGASAKLRLMEECWPELLTAEGAEPKLTADAAETIGSCSTSSSGGTLDMMSVIKVSQAISGEVYLERLLRRLTGIVIENAGAVRGVLILERDGRLFIEAEGTAEGGDAVVLQSVNTEGNDSLPGSVIKYVARTHEHVVLDDAADSGLFTHDPYIARCAAKSILCTPIVNQGRLTGILYLENNLAAGVFTRERLEVLELLSSQIAISIENARLYEHLTREVAERKQAEAALREERDFSSGIVNETPTVICGLQPDGTMNFVNHAGEALTGYSAEELIGKNCWEIIFPREERRQVDQLLQNLAKGEVCDYELTLTRKDGTKCITSWSSLTRHDDAGRVVEFIGFGNDITERKKTEDLKIAKEAAEKGARVKSEFLATMSHEIRTPMNAIIGFCGLALQTDLSSHQRGYLEKIETSSLSLLGVINDILDFSKIEAGKLEMESVEFVVEKVVRTAIDMISVQAGQKGIGLVWNIAEDVPAVLIGDQLRLGQVLANLASNAVKFTESGTIAMWVELVSREGAECLLRFSVRDSGIGITSEQLSRLFTPFVQADGSVTRRYGGTGLGLAISQRLVERMGGEFSVESLPGVGSTFSFTVRCIGGEVEEDAPLPLPPVRFGRGRREAIDPRAREKIAGAKVLLVEDTPLNICLAAELLERAGVIVETASDGREAVEAVKNSSYDAVLMDVQMPLMSGYEATRLIRCDAKNSALPIIAMTAHAMEGVQEECIEAGMDDYISKPIDIDELFHVLAQWVQPAERKGAAEPAAEETAPLPDIPADVPGIDIDSALERLGGDVALYRKLLRYFVKDYAPMAEAIAEALRRGDRKSAERLAHSLKGLAGSISAARLCDAAEEFEAAIERGEEEAYARLQAELQASLSSTLESVRRLTVLLDGEDKNGGEVPGTQEEIAPIVIRMAELLREYNPDAEKCLDALAEKGVWHLFPEETARLGADLAAFDFENGLCSLEKIARKLDIYLGD